MIKILKYYFKIWWLINVRQIIPTLTHNWTFLIFLLGKILRFFLFGAFITFLVQGSNTLAGYNLKQIIFFYLTFFLIDTISQFLFREVYRFRPQIVSGSFDLILVKPVNPLFRSLMGGADAIDLLTLFPLVGLVIYYGSLLSPSILHTAFYIILIFNGLLLSAAFHIAVLALGVITLEIDHTVMIFRDLESLARFPVDIYKEPLKSILIFGLPIGVMITVPAKALMGLISIWGMVGAITLGVIALYFSLKFWNFALKRYTSASS